MMRRRCGISRGDAQGWIVGGDPRRETVISNLQYQIERAQEVPTRQAGERGSCG
jgi:hypothetical protein